MIPDFERARSYAVKCLENELSPRLTYHNAQHTLGEVAPAAERLAIMERVGGADRMLLLTAAYYHDLGFTIQRQGHEAISVQMAKETLPAFGYAEPQVEIICGIIQATCVPQSPASLLEMIMVDADLVYLGQENFWARSMDLRQELQNFGTSMTDKAWYMYQIQFIEAHRYFTSSARSLRDQLKQHHLADIQARLAQIK